MVAYGPMNYTILGIKIPYWGTFFAIAILIAIIIFIRNLKKTNDSKNDYINAIIHLAFWGFAGMILYSLIAFPRNIENIYDIVKGRQSFGSFLGFLVAFIYLKYKKKDAYKFLDIFLYPMLLIALITRIGCAIVLDEVGKITTLPFGIFYANALRHPIAIYYIIVTLLIIVFLIFFDKKFNVQNKYPGLLTFTAISLYSITRFFLDFMRVMPIVFMGLEMNQIMYLSLFVFSTTIIIIKYNKFFKFFKIKKK
jgi:phosphatidylglycerol---prolipoprotein diacylglyceryl transferase